MTNQARHRRDKTVPLRKAKATLSELTKQAKHGTRVVITNHGAPIADLVQHGEGKQRTLKRPGRLPKLVALSGRGPTASELALADREG